MKRTTLPASLCWMLLAAVLIVPSPAKAQTTYNAYVGGETKDQSVQADAFFPNEVWLFEGDSIKWTFARRMSPTPLPFLRRDKSVRWLLRRPDLHSPSRA